MRHLLIGLLGATALFASLSTAEARDGCGRGYYFNGYRCAPMGRYYYRDYDGPRAYYYDYDGPRYRYRAGPWPTFNGCPPNYTVQDGVCKPYRGY